MDEEPVKLLFAGTPEFAATALARLLNSPYQILGVYTQPDRPAGRGLRLLESPVKILAKAHQLPIFQPQSLKEALEQKQVADFQADLMIVAAYGLLLPKAVLEAPRLGCINIHASLLPRWRGAAPIQRAILAGDNKTGITIMQMNEGLDTGPILLQAECPINAEDNSASLQERLAQLGAETVIAALDQLRLDTLRAQVQDEKQASYAAKITKEEGRINWKNEAAQIDRQIRAFYPWPIAFSSYQGETLRIHEAKLLMEETKAAPGSIVALSPKGLDLATAKGLIRLLRVQAAGGRVLAISDFLNARREEFIVGRSFE